MLYVYMLFPLFIHSQLYSWDPLFKPFCISLVSSGQKPTILACLCRCDKIPQAGCLKHRSVLAVVEARTPAQLDQGLP